MRVQWVPVILQRVPKHLSTTTHHDLALGNNWLASRDCCRGGAEHEVSHPHNTLGICHTKVAAMGSDWLLITGATLIVWVWSVSRETQSLGQDSFHKYHINYYYCTSYSAWLCSVSRETHQSVSKENQLLGQRQPAINVTMLQLPSPSMGNWGGRWNMTLIEFVRLQ